MANPFETVIEAVDKATSPLRNIAHAFTGLGNEAQKAGKKVKEADHPRGFMVLSGHINLLRGHFGRLNESIGEVGHSITEFLPMIAGIGAAGSLVGLFEMTEHVSEVRGQLNAMAKSIGITAAQLDNLNVAANLMDVPVDRMDRGMQRLGRTIGDAVGGRNKDAAALFAHLGISLRDASGHLRSANDLLPQLSDAFQHTTDSAMRARMASSLFGQRMGMDLIPFLMEGSAGLKELQAAAAKVNYAPTAAENQGLEAFHRNWILLEAAVTGFTTAIAAKLAPVLAPLVGQFTDWVATNRDWIATGIATEVGKLGTFLQTIHLHDIVNSFEQFAHTASEVIGFLGPFNTMVGASVLVLGSPLLGAVGSAITIFGSLGKALLSLGAIAWANPILDVVVVLGVAAYELWQHWDWVRDKFAALFTWFSGQNAWVQTLLTAIMPMVFLPMEIIKNWEPIREFFTKLFDDLTGIFGGAMKALGPFLDKIGGALHFLDRTGGKVSGPAMPPGLDMSGMFVPPAATPLPSPFNPGSAAAPTIARGGGTNRLIVDLNNAPPGTRTRTETSGTAPPPEVNVGYSMPAFAF